MKGQFSDRFIEIIKNIKAKIIARNGKIDHIQIIVEDCENSTVSYTASKDSETKKKNKKKNF